MKLAILGGTGKTGQHVVQQALDDGHEVVVLARTPSKMSTKHPKLSIVKGDILNQEAIETTIKDVDVVISVLGPSDNKPEFTVSRGMDFVLGAMKKYDVRRLIISAGAGIRIPEDKPTLADRFFGFLIKVISKNVVADMMQVVDKVKASDRDWTVVRVPMLTDKPAKGTFKVGYVGDISPQITRADMASFMLRQAEDVTYVRDLPAISN